MIKSTELRINNWVYNSTTKENMLVYPMMIAQLSRLEKDGGQSVNIHPIPLTEEIILKCGFEYQKDNNSYQLDSDLGFTIWGRVYSGFNVYVDDVEFGEIIHSLHNLQNIIHALTGQELEVKI